MGKAKRKGRNEEGKSLKEKAESRERNGAYLDLTVQVRGKINGAESQQLGKVAYGVKLKQPL